jgi:DNA-binding response OmpR family regulator
MSQGAPGRILVVEDPAIRSYLRAVLSREGYLISHANLDRAVEMIRLEKRPDLLITDEPAVFLEFADRLPLLYTTTYPDPEVAEKFFACQVLIKPFKQAELLAAVKTLCDLGSAAE